MHPISLENLRFFHEFYSNSLQFLYTILRSPRSNILSWSISPPWRREKKNKEGESKAIALYKSTPRSWRKHVFPKNKEEVSRLVEKQAVGNLFALRLRNSFNLISRGRSVSIRSIRAITENMVHDFNLVGCDIRWKKRQIERVTLLEGMRTKIGGRTLRVDETIAKSADLLESKIDEVKDGIPGCRWKTRNGEVVLIFRKRWQNGSSWRKWVEIGDLERRISYWGDQDFRRSLYLRFSFYQNSLLLLLLCAA